jgi:beta-lactamase regulating signal transducer with metallopeptidase domain
MTYWMLAATIAFSVFAVTAAATSGLVAWLAPEAARRLERYSPASRAAMLFRIRMLPAALAALVAFGIAMPVFFWFEPRDTGESVSRTLLVLGLAGASLVLRGAWRAVSAWRATRRVLREWQSRGRRSDLFDAPLPVFVIEESFPTVAVVGIARPALFIAERVLRECTADEVNAMLLHECAHVTKRDNLKRFLIRACPDWLGSGTALDRAWTSAAEEAADAAAVVARPAFALELAQALIRVARLAPSPAAPELASAFYLGGSIESRVRRLVDPGPAPHAACPFGATALATAAVCAAATVALTAGHLHEFMETLVRQLP